MRSSMDIDELKKDLIEWMNAPEEDRPSLASGICSNLCWELDLSKIPYNSNNSNDMKDWRWITKTQEAKINGTKEGEE